MTAREYAVECGIEIIGKLTKKVHKTVKWDYLKGEEVEVKTIYFEDENGTTINGSRTGGWCLTTSDGSVY